MIRRATLVAALLIVASACSGPHSPLDVGVREIDTDVLIGPGRPAGAARPPLAPAPRPVGFPGFVQPPVIVGPPPTPSPVACPQADPNAPVAHEATTSATKPPVPATYPYSLKGVVESESVRTPVSEVVTRTVRNVVRPATGNDFAFDVVIPQAGGAKTTTTYHVYPAPADPTDTTSPGLYIQSVVTEQPGAEPLTFTPNPALLILQFPAALGTTWTAQGVDPFNGTVEKFTGTIAAKEVVDACGTKLDSWRVDITEGSLQSPFDTITFNGSLWIATQFGGLSIRDRLDRSGTHKDQVTDSGTQTHSILEARILKAARFPE